MDAAGEFVSYIIVFSYLYWTALGLVIHRDVRDSIGDNLKMCPSTYATFMSDGMASSKIRFTFYPVDPKYNR